MKQNSFVAGLGATSGRTTLGSSIEGGLNLEETNRFLNHLIGVGGYFYWDIYALYHHIIDGLKLVAHHGESIASIGIDAWGVDFILLGKDRNLFCQPYAYRDPHIVGAPEAFFSHISRSEVHGKTGIRVMNLNLLFQLNILCRSHDSALEAADKVLFMSDVLSCMLTGKMIAEYTIVSTAQLVNAHTQHLGPELLEAVGLKEENSGRFILPGEKIGTLTEEVQRITGLGAIPVIAVARHDTRSVVAVVPALDRNFAYLSSGTQSLMRAETDASVIIVKTEVLSFTNEGGIEGTIRLLKDICGAQLLKRCRPNWGDTSYPELIAEADLCEPSRSLINPDDGCFADPADMEQVIRGYCRTTGQPVSKQRGQMVRCIFENLALRCHQVLENLRTFSPRPTEALHVIGGGNHNDLLNQFTASTIGIPVVIGPSEATAIGNVMIQTMTMGEATDVIGMRQLIGRLIPLKTYYPQDMAAWDVACIHFKSCIR